MSSGLPEDHVPRRESRASISIFSEQAPLITNVENPTLYHAIEPSDDRADSPGDIESVGAEHDGTESKTSIYATIAVLLLGVFISNTDQSLVLATYNTIASDFNDLNSGAWLMSSFIMAQCVVQPLYGKLSDIYGRKACLQTSYILFIIGTAGAGLGQSMGQVIAFRVIQGAGSAGMGSMVSIIITDLVPIREVAALRSYVNVLHTTGRSCGGVIGGYLTQKLSWRWAFLVQVPPTVLAFLLVQWRLRLPRKDDKASSHWAKLRRIDFPGALFLCLTIFSACFVLETGGQEVPWNSPVIIVLMVVCGLAALAFAFSATRVAEPIFPLRLITHYVVVTNYLIVILQSITQLSLMLTVAVYFQVTDKATTAAAGANLIPAFVGNTVGGLASGYWIKRTGRYKTPIILAPISGMVCMGLCYFLWNGHTTLWESLFTLPGGLAMGLISSASFVALAAGVGEEDIAVAGSGVYLCMNLGAVAGVSIGSSIFHLSLQSGLENALAGLPDGAEKIRQSLSDITFVQQAGTKLRELIVPCFVDAFHNVNLLGFVCSAIALLISALTKEHSIIVT